MGFNETLDSHLEDDQCRCANADVPLVNLDYTSLEVMDWDK